MYRIINKNIFLNRGDKITIRVANKTDIFRVGEYLKFYVCQEGNYNNVLLEKRVDIDENTDIVDISLTSTETRIGDPLKTGSKTYWYEIELDGNTTLVGYDGNGPKLFVLYPEAASIQEGGE